MNNSKKSESLINKGNALKVNSSDFSNTTNSVMDVMVWDRVAKGVYKIDAIANHLKISKKQLLTRLNKSMFEVIKGNIFMQ